MRSGIIAAMRPRLSVLEPELIERVVDEAKRVLATHGMEVRGPGLRQRLLDAGLPQRPDGRILFPRDVVEEAIRVAPRSSPCTTARASRGRTSARIGSTSSPARPG